MGKGGGGTTESRSYSSQLPEYAQAYYEPLIREAEMLAYGADYPMYQGPRIAEFSPEELAAFEMRRRMSEQPDPYAAGAANALFRAEQMMGPRNTIYPMGNQGDVSVPGGVINFGEGPTEPSPSMATAYGMRDASEFLPTDAFLHGPYAPPQFDTRHRQSTYSALPSFDAGDIYSEYQGPGHEYYNPFSEYKVSAGAAPEFLSRGLVGIQGGGSGKRDAGSQVYPPPERSYDEYMSPYMSQVTQREKDAATEEYERQRNRNQAQLIASGARGGYREYLDDAMGGAMHQEVLAGIEGKGQQRAFEMAQQQQERDRQAQMNFQRMNMEASKLNQDAFMRARELGDSGALRQAQMRMEAGAANQQAYQRALELQDTAAMREAEMQLNALLDYERRSLQTQELGYRGWMDTIQQQQGLAAASAEMGQLAEANYMRRLAELERAGVTQREMAQKLMDQSRADFTAQAMYPQQQLNWLMGLLGGVPVAPETTMMTQPATAGIASQLLGLGVGLGGLGKLMGE